MRNCTYNQATGEILKWTSHPEDPPEGCVCEERDFDSRDGYILDGDFVPMPERPGPWAVWDWASHAWTDPRVIADLRAGKMAELKSWRDTALKSFTWDGSTFDSDDTAQIRLLGLLTASKEEGFTSEWWRLSDNSWRELFAADVSGVWAALKDNLRSCFQRFAYLEALVAACETPEQLASLRWSQ
jgi:hypothetical protein